MKFFLIAEDEVYAGDAGDGFGGQLGVASDDGGEGIGIASDELADELSGFCIGFAGDGAGMDDAEVGGFAEGDEFVAGISEILSEKGGFGLIKPAP